MLFPKSADTKAVKIVSSHEKDRRQQQQQSLNSSPLSHETAALSSKHRLKAIIKIGFCNDWSDLQSGRPFQPTRRCRRRRRLWWRHCRRSSRPGKRAVQLHRLQPDALRRQAGAEAEVENHQFRLKSLQPVLARFNNFFALVLFFN